MSQSHLPLSILAGLRMSSGDSGPHPPFAIPLPALLDERCLWARSSSHPHVVMVGQPTLAWLPAWSQLDELADVVWAAGRVFAAAESVLLLAASGYLRDRRVACPDHLAPHLRTLGALPRSSPTEVCRGLITAQTMPDLVNHAVARQPAAASSSASGPWLQRICPPRTPCSTPLRNDRIAAWVAAAALRLDLTAPP
jgi:hypothetical protein